MNLLNTLMLLLLSGGCTNQGASPKAMQECQASNGEMTHGGCRCVDSVFDPKKHKCEKERSFAGSCQVDLAFYKPNGNCRKKYDSFEGIVPESGDCSGDAICVPLQAKRTVSKIAADKCFQPVKNKKRVDGKCLHQKAKLISIL